MLAGNSVTIKFSLKKFHKFHTNIDVTSFSIKSIEKKHDHKHYFVSQPFKSC